MNESNLGGVSVRGWVTILLIATTCAMAFLGKEIKEPLYSLVLLSAGFYFGSRQTSNGALKPSSPTLPPS